MEKAVKILKAVRKIIGVAIISLGAILFCAMDNGKILETLLLFASSIICAVIGYKLYNGFKFNK